MGDFGIGQPVPREEDPYLVSGNGPYVDVVKPIRPARTHALRAPPAHAPILALDREQPPTAPGLVLRHRLVIHRLTTNSMAPRGGLADYGPRDDRTTLRCTVQVPHSMRRTIAEEIFEVPETKFRIIAENVGGGFGMKGALYPEYPLTALAARLTGRPVKWMSERSEGFLSDEHRRDNVPQAGLARHRSGQFLGFRVSTFAHIGAYY